MLCNFADQDQHHASDSRIPPRHVILTIDVNKIFDFLNVSDLTRLNSANNALYFGEPFNPFYCDYDWVRWSEPQYKMPALDINW